MIIMIMGVSGCGKTTLGERAAQQLGWPYLEADSFHPQENIDKMSRGEPLNDDDRRPWLQTIRESVLSYQERRESAVFSCSALKESYRQLLNEDLPAPMQWVYLRGSYEVIFGRMSGREGHYFKADMLKSQFEALEEPDYGLILDIEMPLEEKIARVTGLV